MKKAIVVLGVLSLVLSGVCFAGSGDDLINGIFGVVGSVLKEKTAIVTVTEDGYPKCSEKNTECQEAWLKWLNEEDARIKDLALSIVGRKTGLDGKLNEELRGDLDKLKDIVKRYLAGYEVLYAQYYDLIRLEERPHQVTERLEGMVEDLSREKIVAKEKPIIEENKQVEKEVKSGNSEEGKVGVQEKSAAPISSELFTFFFIFCVIITIASFVMNRQGKVVLFWDENDRNISFVFAVVLIIVYIAALMGMVGAKVYKVTMFLCLWGNIGYNLTFAFKYNRNKFFGLMSGVARIVFTLVLPIIVAAWVLNLFSGVPNRKKDESEMMYQMRLEAVKQQNAIGALVAGMLVAGILSIRYGKDLVSSADTQHNVVKCPHCDERIDSLSTKCKYCGETLS